MGRSAIENQIIQLLQSKDSGAVRLIFEHYGPTLLGIIIRIVSEKELAEDVLQESLVKVWKNAGRYDAKKGRLFTWLLNICRNTAIDKMRSPAFKKQQAIHSEENLVGMASESQRYEFNPDQIGLRDWVHKLSPEQIEVIEIVYFSGYSHREAAEKLHLPLGTLKTRLRAALQQLRKMT